MSAASHGHRGAGRRRAWGFTLVEVLVAITLLALLSTALVAVLRTSVRVTEAAVGRVELTQEARVVSGFVRDWLAAMVPVITIRRSERAFHLEGEAERLQFVADLPARFRAGGLWEVTLKRERTEGDRAGLVMARHLVHPDFHAAASAAVQPQTSERIADHRVLLADAEVEFSYYGAPARTRELPRWRDAWRGEWGTPTLVKVSISTPDAGAWPSIIVRPRAERVRSQVVRTNRDAPGGESSAGEQSERTGSSAEADPDCAVSTKTGKPEC